jgi:hypothetical protein
LHTQCSNCLFLEWRKDEGGENRESESSLAQRETASNDEIVRVPVVPFVNTLAFAGVYQSRGVLGE